jgi:predicted AAA+ superfamily ATPase
MLYVPRLLGDEVRRAARAFPALILSGPRRAGKTTLLRHVFPRAQWVLLEDPDVVARVRADPRTFLDALRPPVILDEVQNTPELLSWVRTRIDMTPARTGQWILTGSQEAPLMAGVTESLAGRAAVLTLLPMSTRESPRVSLFRGGFPEAVARPRSASLWFASYLQTYLERDVRAISDIRDLPTFRRFLALVASRTGQVLNKTDLAAPMGVSVPTITHWLGILEVSAQIVLVPPYFENFGKRLVKSPRLYLGDSGLACHLLGLDSAASLERSPFLGPLWEGFVAAEILKQQSNAGRRRELYWFRDQQGLEVDFIVPRGDGRFAAVEAKAGRTLRPEDARPLERLTSGLPPERFSRFVVHRPPAATRELGALRPGTSAGDLDALLDHLRSRR